MRETPGVVARGDVTFCFTDIESSTRLLKQVGEQAYNELLERHRSLIRAAAAAGGDEVKAEGDGFLFAFPTATTAVAFAVDAQRALAAEPWPNGVTLTVRIGMHSGTAERRTDGDYMALAVHQAARVVDAGHGGQVLLTADVASAADAPPDVRLERLGAFRIRDFDGPVELFQLAGPGLPTTSRPIRVARYDLGLPLPRTSTVGRDAELAELTGLVPGQPVVTLVGPGGIGKSRLALETAAAVAGTFTDGVHLVELSPVTEPGLVAATVAAAAGVRPAPNQEPLAALLATFAGERRLLVLDSCERVLDAVAPLVDELTRACPGLSVLATTTEPLRVPLERIVPVGPLAVPAETADDEDALAADAVRLLMARAALAGGDVDDMRARPGDLATITRRLDGIPLAVELAAGRVAELGVAAVVGGLDDRFALLTNGYRTGLPRHRTLEGAVEWTVSLLDDVERDALERLSALAGRWPVDLAAEVCRLGERGPDVIRRLADRALVVIEGDCARVRLLDTIRAYATSRRDPSTTAEIEADRDAAAWHRLQLLRDDAEDVLFDEIDALLPDILAATDPDRPGGDPQQVLALVGVASPWFEIRGFWQEGERRLTAAIERGLPSPARSNAVTQLANLLSLRGRQDEATSLSRQVIDDAHASPQARAMALMTLFAPGSSHSDGGLDPIEEAIRLSADAPIVNLAARSRRAAALLSAGDAPAAADALAEVIAAAEARGRWTIAAQARTTRGGALALLGRLDEADEELCIAEEQAAARRSLGVVGAALSTRAMVAFRRGDLDGAIELAERRIRIAQQMSDLRGEAPALGTIVNACIAKGDLARARDAGRRTVELSRALGQNDGVAIASFNLVVLAEATADHADAARSALMCLDVASRTGAPLAVALSLVAAGGIASALGDARGPLLLAAAETHSPPALPFDANDRAWLERATAAADGALEAPIIEAQRAAGATMALPAALSAAHELLAEVARPS